MMWEACAEKIAALGGEIAMGRRSPAAATTQARRTWNLEFKDQSGDVQTIEAEHVISSAPMRELVRGLTPAVSERARRAADSLRYRDFLTVMLILKDRDAV